MSNTSGDNTAGTGSSASTSGDWPLSQWPKAIIFDLDGTLVNSAPDVRLAINEAFEPLGVGPFTLDQVRSFIGGGAAKALSRALTLLAREGSALDTAGVDQDALMRRFLDAYMVHSKAGRGLYPGAEELLATLQKNGMKMAICTNKAAPITTAATQALGIVQYFDGNILGAREDLAKKPDPAILREALAQLGVTASDAVMIGDSSADVGAAKAAGLPIVLMSYGYTPDPAALGPDVVIDTLDEVIGAVSALRPTK